ncbi:hypothetical protein Dda_4750 [Drechslerella dactyloides]|uniref:Poly [ADP-ribose] polymerase n=1 Tax=Drechslerella dactyloides TaxID=74499 RepID=A0AAD6IYW8_DREDA|nr:hypothetical protein Dda_4750 [Drechslerella dactyloides]
MRFGARVSSPFSVACFRYKSTIFLYHTSYYRQLPVAIAPSFTVIFSSIRSSAAMAPLDNLVFALSGTFDNMTKKDVEVLISNAGGTVKSSVTKAVTHLITTPEDFQKKNAKVIAATANGLPIVSIDWLQDSVSKKKKQPESKYDLAAPPAPAKASRSSSKASTSKAAASASQTATITGKKRGRKAADDEEEEEEEAADDKKAAKGKGKAKAAAAPKAKAPAAKKRKGKKVESEDEDEEMEDDDEEEEEEVPEPPTSEEVLERERQKTYKAPVDELCWLKRVAYEVYEDDDHVKYDASLNQTNIRDNNNKFYILQLLKKGATFAVWTRWGRVGEGGQTKCMDNLAFAVAMKEFNKKFKDKTGVIWEERLNANRPGKYTYLEKDYAPPDEEKKPKDEPDETIESKLPAETQTIVHLIFNKQFMQESMANLNYDSKKLPLGRLNKNTILQGYNQLKAISEALDSRASSDVFEMLTNRYYSIIPHSFGRDRPRVINSDRQLKAEMDLVQSLGDMAIAEKIMKDVEYAEDENGNRIHPLDKQFASLGLRETTPLDPEGSEYTTLRDYFHKTHGHTHYHMRARVVHIFRIERQGEKETYAKEKYDSFDSDNRRLLWHGSRATNFAGILSQGLRIAPPEAPVNGYMFGKGVYLADISTKSAGYCVPSISGNMGLMLLCEAQLGDPMLELTQADYHAAENAKKNACLSTFGMGNTAPGAWMDAGEVHPDLKGVKMPNPEVPIGDSGVAGAYLQYNEYTFRGDDRWPSDTKCYKIKVGFSSKIFSTSQAVQPSSNSLVSVKRARVVGIGQVVVSSAQS